MKTLVETIKKEQIKFLKFPKEDVLNNKIEKLNRSVELHRALYLGNIEHEKVRIVFSDGESLKRVETTIWAVTDKSVILKQSAIIPLSRILSVA